MSMHTNVTSGVPASVQGFEIRNNSAQPPSRVGYFRWVICTLLLIGVTIKALKGPLPNIPLVPTGGVNLITAGECIQAGAAALGIGGELVQSDALKSGNSEIIIETA